MGIADKIAKVIRWLGRALESAAFGAVETNREAELNQMAAFKASQTQSEGRLAWYEMTGEDLPHLDGSVPADCPHEELARLRAYYTQTEAMRRSILDWMSGTPTKEGWMAPHGWKELREALSNRTEMT